MIKQLSAGGATITNQQKAVQIDLTGGRIVGHIDGWIELIGPGSVLEIKAIGKTPFKRLQSFPTVADWVLHNPGYAVQISGAMIALKAKAFYAVKSRDSGEIVTHEIDEPFFDLDWFQERMDRINDWAGRNEWPECEKDGFCWNGPYRHCHYKEGEDREPTPFTKLRNDAVENLAERLYDVRRKRKAAEELEDDLKKELLGMVENGAYEGDRLVIRVSEREMTRIDTKRVREEHGDAYDVVSKHSVVNVEVRG